MTATLTTSLALGLAALAVYGLGRALIARLVAGGAAEEEARRAEAALATAQRQASIMSEDRTRDDVAKDLDRGDF